MFPQTLFNILFVLLMLPGVIGVIMMLPGISYIYALAWIFGLLTSFEYLTMNELIIIGIGWILSLIIDQTAGFFGAYWGGARGRTFLFGALGTIFGLFIMPPLGGIIGLAVGLFLGELYRRRHHEEYLLSSIKTSIGGVLGSALGITINTTIAVAMIVLFVILFYF